MCKELSSRVSGKFDGSIDHMLSDIKKDQASEPAVFKRFSAAGLEIEHTNISSILDTVAEGDEADDKSKLDDARERLVFGVMRSLESEGSLSCNGVASDLDLSDLEKLFHLHASSSSQRTSTLNVEHPPCSVNDKSQQYQKSVDIGF
ncbi:hypothetical protein O6H91_20G059100 [Diphasiastrum complanatum]|uniref:Uncharacterized protein n=1 Tax=Diphasiastrum complanatum TaxID=34168 RepID=A0ACC2AQQ8_DIPCM|nr:hypothetical protein O6H91_20G059100 [Diphasiastrum complanatum]